MRKTRMTAAQVIVAYLINEKVPYVIGMHGHGDLCLAEALAEQKDKITFIQCKNEQYGAMTAAAYAKQTGRPLAVVTSTGPGSTNLVTAAATAYANSLPMLLIPGDTFASGIGPVLQQIEGHTEIELRATDALRPVSRYFVRINRAEQLQKRLPEAFSAMLRPGQEGPAVIALPMDVQAEAYDYDLETLFLPRDDYLHQTRPSEIVLYRAVKIIKKSKRPVIIAGGGVIKSRAWQELQELAESIDAPVLHTQAGMGTLLFEHPLSASSCGVTGTLLGNKLAREADLVIGVGTRYTDFTTSSETLFQRGTQFININISPFDAVKQRATCLWGDAKETLFALAKAIRFFEGLYNNKKPSYRKEIKELKKEWIKESDELRNLGASPLAQSEVIGLVNDFFSEKGTVVASAGSLPGDLQKLWRAKDPERKGYHVEYGYSAMGYEIAGGLGVKLAEPKRDVCVLVGDGSFLMASQELVTAVQERIAFTVVLLDNGEHRSIRGCQENNGFEVFATQLKMRKGKTLSGKKVPLDYLKISRGYGAKALLAKTREELKLCLKKAGEEKKRPTVILVPIDPERVVGNYWGWWDVPRPQLSQRKELLWRRRLYQRNKNNQVIR